MAKTGSKNSAKSGKSKATKAPVKSWQARSGVAQDALAVDFVESLSFDARLAKQDITGSIAHATMLKECKLITAKDLAAIKRGLKVILADIEAGIFKYDITQEDIHMAVEGALIDRIKEPGRRLHTARSRNDQVALDIRLWCREAIATLHGQIRDVQRAFVKLAAKQGFTPMPSFTHLQRAQPITAGHELLAYCEMLERDTQRLVDCYRRVNICPLGAGAVGGSTLPINRKRTAALLGMDGITDNSLDSISDRDFLLELAFDLSVIAMHLSRWAEQWILYCTTEFGFIKIDDKFTTGSSMMPQKRNPDMLELIRGKTGVVYGQLMGLLTMMKGQPLAYNRDMQEDKRMLFLAYDQVSACLVMAAAIVGNTQIQPKRIEAQLDEGFSDATVLAEYLVKRGVPFRTAHHISGTLVGICDKRGLTRLSQLTVADMQAVSPVIQKDVFKVLGAAKVIENYVTHGAGGVKQLKAQLEKWAGILKN